MAKEEQSNALANIAPVGAPVLGAVLAIAFIGAVLATNKVPDNKEALQKTVSTVSTRMGSSEVNPPEQGEIPLADSVKDTMTATSTNSWKPAKATKLLKLPVMWQVELEVRGKDEFEEFDIDGDGYWSKDEFARRPPEPSDLRAKFENWDRYGASQGTPRDGLISREEFEDPPQDTMEQWTKLNTRADDYLDAQDGEISEEQEYAWDTHPYDGKIDYTEFEKRFEERAERNLGPVSGVRVSVDTTTMEIVVNWSEPSIDFLPEDIMYSIERFAPETYDARDSAYKRAMADWMKVWGDYNNGLQKWLDETDAEGKKNRDKYPRGQWKEKHEEETGNTEPPEPAKPELWERVMEDDGTTPLLVSGTEFRDRTFDTEVTYTYAVTMATQKNPKRGQKAVQLAGLGKSWYVYPDRQVQEGHPAYVRNRVEMRWKSQAGQGGTVYLYRWHRIGKDWFKVRVTQSLEQNDSVGGVFSKSQLEDLDGVLIDVSGTESSVEPLPDDDKVDLSTGFSFVTNLPRGFLINSRELGDFELPRATAQEATEKDDAAGKDNPIEVRALTVKNGGKEGVFEVTRWHKVDDQWLRVVWQDSVKKDGDVGGTVDLGSPGKNVTVYDASGKQVTDKFKDQTVDLNAGSYDKLDGRTVEVGGEGFDLFGALYKE